MDQEKHNLGPQQETGTDRRFIVSGVVVLFLAALTAIAWSGSAMLEREARERSASMIRTVLTSSYSAINLWTSAQLRNAESMAADPEFKAMTKELLAVPRIQKDILTSVPLSEIRKMLSPELTALNYLGFFVITPDYVSVGSMRDSNVGTQNVIAEHRRDILDMVLTGESKVIPAITSDVPLTNSFGRPIQRQPTMFVAVPIWDEGVVIAALALRIDPVRNFSRILEASRIGTTGETYAFDREGWLITESRFDEQLRLTGALVATQLSVLNIRITDPGGNTTTGYRPKEPSSELPLTYMAQRATKGEYGANLEGYRDYRGVRVLGVWGWDEGLGFGMTTEIDESEALRTYHVSRSLLVAGYGLTAFLALSMAWYLSRLRETNRQQLAEAHANLETRIEERTRELVAINERMHGEIVERVRTEEQLLQTRSDLETANEKLEMLASLDGLTGLANRRIFNESLEREWKRCIRENQPMSVIMLDIDHFKLYNDTYGHQAGDDCLRAVAHLMEEADIARRPGDLLARYGGEEFVVILSNAAYDYAMRVARRILDEMEKLAMPHTATRVENVSHVTVSIGLGCMQPRPGDSESVLLKRADEALYKAKEQGRNRVATFEDDACEVSPL